MKENLLLSVIFDRLSFTNNMFSPHTSLLYYLHQYWYDFADPRIIHLPILNLPPLVFFSCMMFYLILVTKLIPTFMRNRPAFDNLRGYIFLYNVCLVLVNLRFFLFIFIEPEPLAEFWTFDYPHHNDNSPRRKHLIWMAYLYYLSKLLDLFDTVFFALRKKNSHITLLHLYHHTSVRLRFNDDD